MALHTRQRRRRRAATSGAVAGGDVSSGPTWLTCATVGPGSGSRNIVARERSAVPPRAAGRRAGPTDRWGRAASGAPVRVVAGTARGRRLVAPKGVEVRPTSDRVREATFNSLASVGALAGARVLDLFAGSGALGIEALSRGAEHATFVDSSRAAVMAIEENLATCGLGDRATVVRSQAAEHLRRAPGPYDLALLDPPYASDDWQRLLSEVRAAVLVVESDREIEQPPHVEVRRVRRYGGTVVTIAADVDREGHPSRSSEDRS